MPPKQSRKKGKKKNSEGVAKSKRRQPKQDGRDESGAAPCAVADGVGAAPDSAPDVLREREQALKLYRRGLQYLSGNGEKQSFVESARYVRKAAEMGLKEAQCHLGAFYDDGLGVLQDSVEAARWYRQASDQGYAHAQNSLAVLYQNGTGVPQDMNESARLYHLAADAGDAGAQFNLGSNYRDGKGVEQNYAKAARLFQLATAQGHSVAQGALGSLYLQGNGVPQDIDKARRLFELSAAKGCAPALLSLGKMYEGGWGVERNVALAKRYYRRAGNDYEFAPGKTTEDQMMEYLDTIKHTCASCKTVGDDLKVCTRCKGPRYCGVACQKADWPEHKRVCQRLAKTEESDRMAQDANDF